MRGAYFEPLGSDRYRATAHTIGPWSPAAQHGGPPSALLAMAVHQALAPSGLRLARVSVDLLGPVPVTELQVETEVLRSGRSVALVEARLIDGAKPVAVARGWALRPSPIPATAAPPRVTGPWPAPLDCERQWQDRTGTYLGSVEWRPVHGDLETPGPGAVWARRQVEVVAGHPTPPMAAALAVADVASGISGVVPFATWYAINVDLHVALQRDPVGEWLLIDAVSAIDPGGTGVCTSTLADADGPCGVSVQTLYVAPRPS